MKKVLYVVIVLLALCLMAASCSPPKECLDSQGNPIDCNAWANGEDQSFTEKAKEAVDDLNQNIQNAAVNAEPPTKVLEVLNQVDDWNAEEKRETYEAGEQVATEGVKMCQFWNGTMYQEEPCQ